MNLIKKNLRHCFPQVQTVNKPLISIEIRGLGNKKGKRREKRLDEALDVLNCGSQEALFTHILDAEHTSKAQAMRLYPKICVNKQAGAKMK